MRWAYELPRLSCEASPSIPRSFYLPYFHSLLLSFFPPLIYGLCWLMRIWPLPHGSLLFCWIENFNVWNADSRVPFLGLFLHFVCLFLSKLVKVSHSPSELRCSALGHARVHAPSIHIYINGSKSKWGCGLCRYFSRLWCVRLSSCSCFDLYSVIMCYFSRPFSNCVPRQ